MVYLQHEPLEAQHRLEKETIFQTRWRLIGYALPCDGLDFIRCCLVKLSLQPIGTFDRASRSLLERILNKITTDQCIGADGSLPEFSKFPESLGNVSSFSAMASISDSHESSQWKRKYWSEVVKNSLRVSSGIGSGLVYNTFLEPSSFAISLSRATYEGRLSDFALAHIQKSMSSFNTT